MKVFIVTSGDYSDYHIDRVFSAREKAREFVDHMGGCYEIEEYSLDEETPRGVFGYRVSLYKDHTEVELTDPAYDAYMRKDSLRWSEDFMPHLIFVVEAKDAPHAVKIASERFMRIKAEPYLFPRLKERCVVREYFGCDVRRETPIYDYNTKKILLDKRERLIDAGLI